MRRLPIFLIVGAIFFGGISATPLRAEGEQVQELTQDQKDRALIWAAMGGDIAKVQMALSAGADIRARDSHDRTAMDYALNLGHQELFLWLHQQGVSFITDAPLHPIDPDMPISPIAYGLLRRQEERKIVQEGAHINFRSGVGAAWPLYEMAPRNNVPPLKSSGKAAPAVEKETPNEPAKEVSPTPVAPAESPTPTPDPPPVKEPEQKTSSVPDACLGINADQAQRLQTWCDAKVFKIKPACVAANCSGDWDIYENKLRCTQCKGSDEKNDGFMLLLGSEGVAWDINSSGQPVVPFNDLLGLVHLCRLPGVTDLGCDTKKELAQKIINP